jgi:hypothetical protein
MKPSFHKIFKKAIVNLVFGWKKKCLRAIWLFFKLADIFHKVFTIKKALMCLETGSNCRHKDFQSFALPTELSKLFTNTFY